MCEDWICVIDLSLCRASHHVTKFGAVHSFYFDTFSPTIYLAFFEIKKDLSSFTKY